MKGCGLFLSAAFFIAQLLLEQHSTAKAGLKNQLFDTAHQN
jgi:hypothetical protein